MIIKFRHNIVCHRLKKVYHASVVAIALIFGSSILYSTPQSMAKPSSGMLKQVTISPKFKPDPMLINGLSGGTVSAQTIAGRLDTLTGPCVGLVSEKPDHLITLTTFFNHLSLQVESQQDTTLIIKGPGGVWCNDDFKGKNPGIAGQWKPGTYQIWVGSYNKAKNAEYRIRISEVQVIN